MPEPLRLDDPNTGVDPVNDTGSDELPAFLTEDDEALLEDEEERQISIAAE